MSKKGMDANAVLLVQPGSETTATTLTALTYSLIKDPEVVAKLEVEVRGAFKSNENIKIEEVSNLSYVEACFKEWLRYFPAVPTGLPRRVCGCSSAVVPGTVFDKNLACLEMRFTLAKMVWNFDWELMPESENWVKDCKLYMIWEKPPLMVRLSRSMEQRVEVEVVVKIGRQRL
ncbi:cytochrome P450 [Zopfia rhizophila CBS 207.26]|uniref:Cytochrome P450 n=1 Tax=Zopfia rhizophila CBS 207.26 TaxID=1314779 RepID=A0A6A6ENA6_9PEZI|nr:cytochrome P450 [Zopfia rhizophila CBS 207.26]